MVLYTFTYFDSRALGEPIRLLFKYAGVDFKDVRITHADWPEIKPSTPTGKLPFLEVEGKVLPESGAILRYLARQFKLIGANEWEAAIADSTFDTYRDFTSAIFPFFLVNAGFSDDDKEKTFKEVYIPNRDPALKHVSEVLSKSKSGFVVDSGLTYVDFVIAEHITTLLNWDPTFEKTFPQLVAYRNKVHAIPQIKDYVASRKPLEF